jgi:hypothetical protein
MSFAFLSADPMVAAGGGHRPPRIYPFAAPTPQSRLNGFGQMWSPLVVAAGRQAVGLGSAITRVRARMTSPSPSSP